MALENLHPKSQWAELFQVWGEFVLQYLEEHPYNLLIGFALLPMGFKFYDTYSTHKTQLLMQREDNRHSEKMLELEIRKSKNEKGDKSC